jgi:L-ascorbate metabolism protein UlaG (beta-lactamase superfamily)
MYGADQIVRVTPLGQAGFRLSFGEVTLYIDPYLSNQVEIAEGPDFRRQVPVWKAANQVDDADWVLVTHTHGDHCDLATLVPMSLASTNARFAGPANVRALLTANGIPNVRIFPAADNWLSLGPDLRIRPMPAAHPEVEFDEQGDWCCVGYLFEYRGRRIYHSGDTSLNATIIESVKAYTPIDVAFLPVNERNHYRDAQGIIGNMSIREAFQFASDLGVKSLVPMHWDMFLPNSVYAEEIDAVSRNIKPPFQVLMNPSCL